MNNDTKHGGIMRNNNKSLNGILKGIPKSKDLFLATQALDFLMTQDDDYLVVKKSGSMNNDIKH